MGLRAVAFACVAADFRAFCVPIASNREFRQPFGFPSRPGIIEQPWGRDMCIADPFGNRLIFCHLNKHGEA